MSERAIWEFTDNKDWSDAEIAVTANGLGLNIAVTDEKAVDSYNQEFTCSVIIPPAKVRELMAFISQFDWNDYPDPPQCT